jgi:amino acid transporter
VEPDRAACQPQSPETPHLKKVLGRNDLILLFVAAVANLNIVPAIAAVGPLTLWMWLLALTTYFWPQGVAVTELSTVWPGEGGVYLWTKNSFGEMHGFFAAWCYWLANVVYLPTVLLSCIGVAVYIFGPSIQALAGDPRFTSFTAVVLLLTLAAFNIRGESAGKWITNLGGIGTLVGAVVICGLAAIILSHHGGALSATSFTPHQMDWRMLAIFGTVCYSLQGLDLASIMGDEIREPRKVLPSAILWGGIISGVVYVGVTGAMLVALPREQIGVMTGVLESISSMAGRVHLGWLVAPVALFEAVAILGTAAAWYGGTARLPFVVGIDHYLPRVLGRVHPRYQTPYVALIAFAALSAILILMSNLGASVSEAYLTLLAISVVLQLIPNVYMFAALLKLARHRRFPSYRRKYMVSNGASGLGASSLGICLAFVPSDATTHVWAYEAKMIGAISLVLIVALVLYLRAQRGIRADAEAAARAMNGDSLVKLTDLS